jgi:hypothetical protein
MARDRTILRETFHAGTKLHEGEHPRLPWLEKGTVVRVDLLARGIVEKGDEVQEYIDVRLWMTSKKA